MLIVGSSPARLSMTAASEISAAGTFPINLLFEKEVSGALTKTSSAASNMRRLSTSAVWVVVC